MKGHLFLAVKIRPTSTVFEWNPEMVAREPWMEQCKDRTEGFRKFVNQCRGVPMTVKDQQIPCDTPCNRGAALCYVQSSLLCQPGTMLQMLSPCLVQG